MSEQYAVHEFTGVDHNAARCPHHPDQVLVPEVEWCGDYLMVCPRFDYRAVQRFPLVEGAQPKWDAPKADTKDWKPPVRRVV
jgi:hypothetical protein